MDSSDASGDRDDGAAPGDDGASGGTGDGPAGTALELLTFPTDFPIKVMGRRVDGFADAIAAVVLQHAPDFDVATMELRASSKGNYLGLTVTIRATSRAQLDALYLALTGHPLVSVVL
jgi:putative lipoic acid-binding regulatory protein